MFFLQPFLGYGLAGAWLPWFWLMGKQTKSQMCWEPARVPEQGERPAWSEAHGLRQWCSCSLSLSLPGTAVPAGSTRGGTVVPARLCRVVGSAGGGPVAQGLGVGKACSH